MIKRIRFATKPAGVSLPDFAGAWRAAVGAAASAPAAARPVRITACSTAPGIISDPVHDGVAFEWFTDAKHLARYEDWLLTADGSALTGSFGGSAEFTAAEPLLASEHIMRGQDWLAAQVPAGPPTLKQMAVATRAAGLTLAQFLQLWSSRAGKVGAAPIPDVARGLAYIQNRPLVLDGVDWIYDAVNEVYFDDVDKLRARIAFFDKALGQNAEDDLVSKNWFIAVREDVLLG